MASSDQRELTPEERSAFGNWYAQQLESDLGLTVPEKGPRSNRMRMERAFAAGLAARASSPAPDAQTHALLRALAAAYDADLIREDAEVDDLFDAGLLRLVRDIADEYTTELTAKGRDAIRAAVASSPVPEDDRIEKAVGLLNAARIGAECTGQHGSVQLFGELIEILSADATVTSSPVPACPECGDPASKHDEHGCSLANCGCGVTTDELAPVSVGDEDPDV